MRLRSLIALVLASASLFASAQAVIAIDESKSFQIIRHFGASAAWWAQELGSWPGEALNPIMDALYDPVKGIGLDLIRYDIGGGKEGSGIADDWRSAESPLGEDGKLDWARDAAAVRVVDEAVRRGASVILFANSPPTSMTLTGRSSGNDRSTNLRPEMRGAFALFLADCALSLGSTRGWPIAAVSPMNEPQWDWGPSKGQEGCRYSPEEAYALIKALAAEFSARGIGVPISAIDSGEWKKASNEKYLALIWGDSSLAAYLSHYAVHSYWSSRADRDGLSRLIAKDSPGLETWMTEWTEMRAGRDAGMDAALVLADTVREDLVYGNASSWQYWIAVSKYDYRDGLVYVDPPALSFALTKKLWALGNYSRFVDRGARRIACDVGAVVGLSASAFENLDGSVACVAINEGRIASAPIRVAAPVRLSWLEAWETSAERNLELAYAGPPKALVLPARSVTTLRFSAPPPPPPPR